MNREVFYPYRRIFQSSHPLMIKSLISTKIPKPFGTGKPTFRASNCKTKGFRYGKASPWLRVGFILIKMYQDVSSNDMTFVGIHGKMKGHPPTKRKMFVDLHVTHRKPCCRVEWFMLPAVFFSTSHYPTKLFKKIHQSAPYTGESQMLVSPKTPSSWETRTYNGLTVPNTTSTWIQLQISRL